MREQPAPVARTRKQPAAAGPPAEPMIAVRASKRPAASPRTRLVATPRMRKSAAATGPRAEPTAAAAAAGAQAELTTAGTHAAPAGPRAELTTRVEPLAAAAATHEEHPWEDRAQTRREERAQRRQERQESARIRRAAAGSRARSAGVAGARAEPAAAAAALHQEPTAAAMRAELPGTDETHGMGRRIQRGTVKWFSDAKGYGFIQADDGTDIFVHRSGIVGDGLRTLHEGQAVEYEQAQSGKGLLAVDVVPAGPGREAARR